MENASKALIIGASVFIAVLMVSVAMFVLNSSEGARKESEKTARSAEVVTFNDQFENYEGDGLSASRVRQLLQLIRANNAENGYGNSSESDIDRFVKIEGITSNNELKVNQLYSVEVTEYNINGYVSTIKIEESE